MRRIFKENWIAGSGISAIVAMLWLASPTPPISAQQEAWRGSEVGFSTAVIVIPAGQASFCSVGPPGVTTYTVLGSNAVTTTSATSTASSVCYISPEPIH
jgi:hypothetical protein